MKDQPAFPEVKTMTTDGRPSCLGNEDAFVESVGGMTLHQWFAGMALSGLRVGDWEKCEDGVKFCMDYADAMIAAYEKRMKDVK